MAFRCMFYQRFAKKTWAIPIMNPLLWFMIGFQKTFHVPKIIYYTWYIPYEKIGAFIKNRMILSHSVDSWLYS